MVSPTCYENESSDNDSVLLTMFCRENFNSTIMTPTSLNSDSESVPDGSMDNSAVHATTETDTAYLITYRNRYSIIDTCSYFGSRKCSPRHVTDVMSQTRTIFLCWWLILFFSTVVDRILFFVVDRVLFLLWIVYFSSWWIVYFFYFVESFTFFYSGGSLIFFYCGGSYVYWYFLIDKKATLVSACIL